ncbi:AbrB/MazE/SpoVT family DNA-binding domain-containing protein [Candidatus Woesearchaeota archaeon]|nr:AbrB/MazE/SpoVT family DNA-binding domain-containing protein [Candidatus Woesearchaeota archaeon]
MELVTKAKKWGSSFGVVIPKRVMDTLGVKIEDEFILDIRPSGRSSALRKLWGKGKGRGEQKTAQEWKDEFRRTLY